MNPTRTRSLLVAVCLGLFDLMAMTAQAGDTTEQPIKQLNEANDLNHAGGLFTETNRCFCSQPDIH